jgi:hypothetical protein
VTIIGFEANAYLTDPGAIRLTNTSKTAAMDNNDSSANFFVAFDMSDSSFHP